MSNKDYSSSC